MPVHANVGRFANESFRQRPFRKRLRSVRKRLWSVRKRVEVSSQTLSTFICVEASSVLISDVNIWPYKLTLKPSLVVDFALSQRLRIACTIAVIRKSIYRYETGLTVVVFYQEAFLFEGRSTTSERPDKKASILGWNINMVAKWRTLNVSMSFLFPVLVVTLVWLHEFFNEVVVIHKHIYCLQLTRITCRDVWAVRVMPALIKTISNSEQKRTSAVNYR